MSNSKKIPLKSTEQISLPGARAIGPSDPHQIVELSVVLKNRKPLPPAGEEIQTMNHNDFARNYGADPAHVDKIRQFAREYNLQVLERGDEVLRRTVTLAATAAAMEKAFSIELTEFEYEDGSYRSYNGPLQLSEDYAPFVSGVFGLDDRPVAQPRLRYRNRNRAFGTRASSIGYTPTQLARLYGFPHDSTGAGQTIAFIELGGGYRPSDIRDYFQLLGLKPPDVKSVQVNYGNNRPQTPHGADGQVMLDIEMAGAIAQEAQIAVYFAPNTARGFQDAVSTAVHDQLHKPSVLAIGWGCPESSWTAQSMHNFDQVAQEAALLGITIAVAAGDNGFDGGIVNGNNHVDFPASCPHVLACGGTRLLAADGNVRNETAWNGGTQSGITGGGYSAVFSRPAWQSGVARENGRGVPDVASNADPETGCHILVDGQHEVVGGTSAAAPFWAGLVVLLNQKLNRRLGFINPQLYSIDRQRAFRDIVMGSNGVHAATYGWDPVTGLGTPIATQLLQALEGAPANVSAQRKESMHAAAAR
ncbi:MAG: S53 family peptidase [Terracidiphilus sp.]